MEGTIGEIRMFAATFAPRNWAYCDGQLQAIQQNQALFSILGTTFGGNGQTTFALPDMRGRVPVGTGVGPGLFSYQLGEKTGTESTTLIASNIPSHTHVISGNAKMLTTTVPANAPTPGGNYFANDGTPKYKNLGNGTMKPANVALSLSPAGGTPVGNLMPYTAISYIICLFGIFPSRD